MPLFVLSRLLASLWVSCTGRASDWCALQEALYKCIDLYLEYNVLSDSPTVDQLFEMVNKRKDQMDSLVHRLETRMDNLVQFQNQQLDSYKKELADMVRLHKDEIDTWMTEIERQGKHKVLTLNSKKNKIIYI